MNGANRVRVKHLCYYLISKDANWDRTLFGTVSKNAFDSMRLLVYIVV